MTKLNDKQLEMLEWAKFYLKKNISVIPVNKNKIPLIPWREFQNRVATLEEADKWWETYPDAQLGMVTGLISGISVVDIEEGGDWSFLPQDTTIAKTGGNGRHYFFKYHAGLGNKARIKDLIDFRSDGGYVVISPSSTEKGSYEWISKANMLEFPVHLFPELTTQAEGKMDMSGVSSLKMTSDAFIEMIDKYEGQDKGSRNSKMTSMAGYLMNRIHPLNWESEVLPALIEANKHNNPPLPTHEVVGIFKSIVATDINNPTSRWVLKEKEIIEQASPEEELDVQLMSVVAEKEKINVSEYWPIGIEVFDTALGGGLIPGDLVTVAAASGQGKCHGKGTRILMHDGSTKNVEDIIIGDQLMGNDSTPRRVLSLARGVDQMFNIIPIKGESFTCNSKHILSLSKKDKESRTIRNIALDDYLVAGNRFKSKHKLYRVGVNFHKKDLPVDPYFLGLWLGDGTSANANITNTDQEIIDYLYKFVQTIDHHINEYRQKNHPTPCTTFAIYPNDRKSKSMTTLLNELNLRNNKHIPHLYKTSDKEDRMKLLAGIIDTDGYYQDNVWEVVCKSKVLRDDIAFLARSLGFAVSIATKHNNQYDRDYYKINIYGSGMDKVPTLVPRKAGKKRMQAKDPLVSGFEVVPLGIGEYYGFELDGNHLYLLGDFTVTHNTTFVQYLSRNLILDGRKVLFISYEVLVQHVWERFINMNIPEDSLVYAPIKNKGNMGWVKQVVEKAIRDFDVKIVIIDHLGFLEPEGKNTNKYMSENYSIYLTKIVRDLKTLAKELEIAIVMPVHMRKQSFMAKKNTLPSINEIQSSAGIAQESDAVFVIMREETITEDAVDLHTKYTKIQLTKNRRGSSNPSAWFLLNEAYIFCQQEDYFGAEDEAKKEKLKKKNTKFDYKSAAAGEEADLKDVNGDLN